jgi:formamidopyrimidine-DNA glycosylase
MPELPEVDTMVTRLKQWVGYKIIGVKIDESMSGRAKLKFFPGTEADAVLGETILDVLRRGKFIVFVTDSGALLCHNAMSGYWDEQSDPWTFDYVEGERESSEDDVRVRIMVKPHADIFAVISGCHTLRFHDSRMFGSLRFVTPEQLAEKFDTMGPDALGTANSYEPGQLEPLQLRRLLGSKKTVKEVLTDQAKVAGVGNIYVAEACWGAGVLPHRIASTITPEESDHLYASVKQVLQRAIDRKLDYGQLRVYRREKCPTCDGPVTTETLKGRSSYWCPRCQK